MENKTLDLLSKLLANENIVVTRDNVPTASFDIKSRVLRLPMFLNMSEEEEIMLAFHEVSHAIFTPEDYVKYNELERQRRPYFSHYLNVVEDVRVERLFKEKYPGARKDFFKGYKSFNERDFFKIASKDTNTLTLIDRINMFYKVGFSSGVKFNSEERAFITKIDAADTITQAYDVAVLVYDYAAEQEKKKREAMKPLAPAQNDLDEEYDFSGAGEPMDFDDMDAEEGGESDDAEQPVTPASSGEILETTTDSEIEVDEDEKEKAAASGAGNGEEKSEELASGSRIIGNQEVVEAAPESETQEAFDGNIKNNTSQSGRAVLNYAMQGNRSAIVIEHKRIVSDFRIISEHFILPNAYAKFRPDAMKMVAHLVKEFEMRKAAKRYSRTQTARTGELSMNKIAKFRVSDDLFKKLDIVADDTNHGFMMLLDWSGSMQMCMRDTIGQVIVLSAFCRRVNIPFTLYAFSDNLSRHFGCDNQNVYVTDQAIPSNYGAIDSQKALMFNFFNSKMSNADFEYMAQSLYNGLYARRLNIHDAYSEAPYALNGTPLTSGLLFVDQQIEKFKRSHNVEKMTLITLTDGEGNGTGLVQPNGEYIGRYAGKSNMRFLRHMASGKTIPMEDDVSIDSSIVRLMRIAHPDVKIIGFFVTPFAVSRLFTYVRRNSISINGSLQEYLRVVSRQGKANGFFEFPVPGYHKMFLIDSYLGTADMNLTGIDENMSSAQIARRLTGTMKATVKSRVVLTKFIEQIA